MNSLGFSSLRLSFTIEDQEETEKVLNAFIDVYCLEKPSRELMLTRGHFRRGAE